jgi:microcompartment protein CcmK/EutM
MFLARIHGTITATTKHPSLDGIALLIGRRLEGDGTESGEPIVIVDTQSTHHGAIALVTTDGDAIRSICGDSAPVRLSVIGLVSTSAGDQT